ncbi:MAG: SlyX protein [Micavibrio aeruginosavorus]|uniref:SlyX protein n=1 Tax=Micavibrio aeruginosavorus TaxID=349221 RepID=A0A2W5FGB5_9BACT|nr:MAG: SlyX protein [Micavibrio aeruginosavorus]
MTEERINSIETALAHHEMQIQELSEIINQQWKEIERLKRNLEKAYDKISEIESSEDTEGKSVTEIAAANKPPHY